MTYITLTLEFTEQKISAQGKAETIITVLKAWFKNVLKEITDQVMAATTCQMFVKHQL